MKRVKRWKHEGVLDAMQHRLDGVHCNLYWRPVCLGYTITLPRNLSFDPYPYIFLNLILSAVAALQAPIILMSQNRQAMRDRLAATLDYEVNLKAEIEIMALHDKMDQFRLGHMEQLIIDLQGRLSTSLR